MFLNQLEISEKKIKSIGSVPAGLEAPLLAELLYKHFKKSIIFVVRDDAQLASTEESLRFFAKNISILKFPAWDCLPYDRISPRTDILGERIATLEKLAVKSESKPFILLTTTNSFIQRVPPPDEFENKFFKITSQGQLNTANLHTFLLDNGYNRTGTVREPGEFSVRGGIIDIFPANRKSPFRIDLFGDEIDNLREFDALTQKSSTKFNSLTIHPVSELIIDKNSIERFRSRYRMLFGNIIDDPLYEAVSNGQKVPGVEHWLPLFSNQMISLADYIPDAPIFLQHDVESALSTRMEAIHDFFDSRTSWVETTSSSENKQEKSNYRPLPPDQLYLSATDLQNLFQKQQTIRISPFADSRPVHSGHIEIQGHQIMGFSNNRETRNNTDNKKNNFEKAISTVEELLKTNKRVFISAYSNGSRSRLSALLQDYGLKKQFFANSWEEAISGSTYEVGFITLGIPFGFICNKYAIISEQDILGDRLVRQAKRKRRSEEFLQDISELSIGDVVVHIEHGLGSYQGLETIDVAGAPHDCIRLSYHGDDKLYVPVENLELLSRFGSEGSSVALDRLGSAAWQARKSRLKKRIQEIAKELIKVAAARTLRPGRKLYIDKNLYDEFSTHFPFQETDDQLKAISETLKDLEVGRPMDRLICGDVGFGKTEVALRAAFTTVIAGGQVAVIAPTTLLVRQHFKSFKERFKGYPIKISQLSRLVSNKDAYQVREELISGSVDIVIGTHALLSKATQFNDLALLIIDEEQHFGVSHKERLKQLKTDVHVLTLSATPIPRTLQMALSGVKDLSIIATPPVDRLAVRTFVMPNDPVTLKEAIMRERYRGGQIFYVCPRIKELHKVYADLKELVPEVKIQSAHGQMPVSQLEDVMNAFYDGNIDLLLSTQIIESGLDIPNANTIIIHRADMFGLAQLYQLRGRIGRSKVRAYCYLTLPNAPLSETAKKRLEVMQSLDSLGAGFTLANHDLDIRGAGNLLGDEQSGHVREVGVELYQKMLEDAVAQADSDDNQDSQLTEDFSPTISISTAVLIPESYVPDLDARLSLYRRASSLNNTEEINSFIAELEDRFGKLPDEVNSLLEIIKLKQLCKKAGIEKLDAGPKGASVKFYKNRFEPLHRLIGFIQKNSTNISIKQNHQLVVRQDWLSNSARLKGTKNLIKQLVELKN